MAEQHQNELTTWGVPRSQGKKYYAGTVAVLMGVISVLMMLLYRSEQGRTACQEELRDERNSSRDYLKEWANKAFDERYKEKQKEMEPKVDEIKASVDSIKNKRI